MELFFEILIHFIFEFLLPLVFEILTEFGVRGASRAIGRLKAVSSPVAISGYIFMAACTGWLTLHFFPNHFIQNQNLRIISLIVAPILVGSFMAFRRKFLLKKDKEPVRLDSFTYGFLFAFTFALIRFIYAT